MASAGRKKWMPPDLRRVEVFAERGLTFKQIALNLGVSVNTLERRRKDLREFSDALERGRAKGIAAVANVVYDLAIKDRDPATCRFIMRAVGGWDDSRRVEVTGPDGGALQLHAVVEAEVEVKADPKILALMERYAHVARQVLASTPDTGDVAGDGCGTGDGDAEGDGPGEPLDP